MAFDERDVSLVVAALDLVPSARAATEAAKRIEATSDYPIESPAQVLELFGKRRSIEVAGYKISPASVKRYFSGAEFFPIPDRETLLARLFLAFERQRVEEMIELAHAQYGEEPSR